MPTGITMIPKRQADAWRLYPSYHPLLPSVILFIRPEEIRKPDLLLGRYDIAVCETAAEEAAVKEWLRRPIEVFVADGRPAIDIRPPLAPAAEGQQWLGGSYQPPATGWPWLLIMRQAVRGEGLHRGVYATDAFRTHEEWLDHTTRIQALIPPDKLHLLAGDDPDRRH